MFIKMIIIAVVAVALLVAFSSEINAYFPNTVTTGLESLKADLGSIKQETLESAEQKITNSSQKITAQLSRTANDTLGTAGQMLDSAEDRMSATGGMLQDGLADLGTASSKFVEENITERVGSLGMADGLEPASDT